MRKRQSAAQSVAVRIDVAGEDDLMRCADCGGGGPDF
jgi:hypothetical protein